MSELIKTLDLNGHLIDGGEVARYMGGHGTKRVAKDILVGALTPLAATATRKKRR